MFSKLILKLILPKRKEHFEIDIEIEKLNFSSLFNKSFTLLLLAQQHTSSYKTTVILGFTFFLAKSQEDCAPVAGCVPRRGLMVHRERGNLVFEKVYLDIGIEIGIKEFLIWYQYWNWYCRINFSKLVLKLVLQNLFFKIGIGIGIAGKNIHYWYRNRYCECFLKILILRLVLQINFLVIDIEIEIAYFYSWYWNLNGIKNSIIAHPWSNCTTLVWQIVVAKNQNILYWKRDDPD